MPYGGFLWRKQLLSYRQQAIMQRVCQSWAGYGAGGIPELASGFGTRESRQPCVFVYLYGGHPVARLTHCRQTIAGEQWLGVVCHRLPQPTQGFGSQPKDS